MHGAVSLTGTATGLILQKDRCRLTQGQAETVCDPVFRDGAHGSQARLRRPAACAGEHASGGPAGSAAGQGRPCG